MLKDWIDNHPDKRVPELAKHDSYSLEKNFAIEATLVDTSEQVWILRLGVIDIYQGWVLEKPDGTCLLVKSQHTPEEGHVYKAWLGPELGYSDQIIAHHKDVPKLVLSLSLYSRKRGLDAEDVLNEYDLSRIALEPEDATASQEGSSSKSLEESQDVTMLTGMSSDSEPLVNGWNARNNRKKRARKDDTYRATDDGSVKKKVKTETSYAAPKTIKAEKTEPLRHVHEFFSRGNLKRLQKGLPQTDWYLDEATVGRYRTLSIMSDSETEQHPKTPRTLKGLHRASNPRTPQKSFFSSACNVASPFAATPTGYPTPHPSPLKPGLSLTTPATTITFHLFVANTAMGAIPVPFSKLTSKVKFFNEAIAAYSLSSQGKKEVVAASVKIKGVARAIIVQKGQSGKQAWDEVVKIVQELEIEGKKSGKGVDVEVKCIA